MKKWAIWGFGAIILALALVFSAYYINLSGNVVGQGRTIPNPAYKMSISEAMAAFNESFVSYILYTIGANELHNPPFSSDTPKIEIYIDSEVYSAEIVKGNVIVKKGPSDKEDIIIRTSKIEAVKMMQGKSYVIDSFKSGNSKIELVAGKVTLFAKGYTNIYNKLG